ncbi:uncharacterized, partial [Tachysurus ichikawai]
MWGVNQDEKGAVARGRNGNRPVKSVG